MAASPKSKKQLSKSKSPKKHKKNFKSPTKSKSKYIRKSKSPIRKSITPTSPIPKSNDIIKSLLELESKSNHLYPNSTDIIYSQPLPIKKPIISSQKLKAQSQPLPQTRLNQQNTKEKCHLFSNKCYIDCINYIVKNISDYEKNPHELLKDLYKIIEPRIKTNLVQGIPINTGNLYRNMVEYTSQKMSNQLIKQIKSIIKEHKEYEHYQDVKQFIKDVKYHKYLLSK